MNNKITKQILETVLKTRGDSIHFSVDDGSMRGGRLSLGEIIQIVRRIGWREGLTAASSHIHPQGRLISGEVSNELCEQSDRIDELANLEPEALLTFMRQHWPSLKWNNGEWALPERAI